MEFQGVAVGKVVGANIGEHAGEVAGAAAGAAQGAAAGKKGGEISGAIAGGKQYILKDARALLLTCIDFRLIDNVVFKLNELGYTNNYDEFALAGASLWYNGIPSIKNYQAWSEVFRQHIEAAIALHNIEEILIIDHLNCGAYGLVYTPEELEG